MNLNLQQNMYQSVLKIIKLDYFDFLKFGDCINMVF